VRNTQRVIDEADARGKITVLMEDPNVTTTITKPAPTASVRMRMSIGGGW